MLISTSYSPNQHLLHESQKLAEALNCQWVPRRNQSINKLRSRAGHKPVLLLTEDGWRLYADGDRPLFFHPGMATLRVQALGRGESDALVEATGVTRGDSILDCTAGLASDAIVFSSVAGTGGHVTALESEQMIYVLLREGLKSHRADSAELNEAMRRIELKHENHLDYLQRSPDRSYDIIYFDPMFRTPLEDSLSIQPLRGVANPLAITPAAVEHACRVARKIVVMKEHKNSDQFEQLGFERLYRPNSKIAYGVIRV